MAIVTATVSQPLYHCPSIGAQNVSCISHDTALWSWFFTVLGAFALAHIRIHATHTELQQQVSSLVNPTAHRTAFPFSKE